MYTYTYINPAVFGTGLFAAEAIGAGEEFVSVPVELAITVDAAKRSKMGETIARFNKEVKQNPMMIDDDDEEEEGSQQDEGGRGAYVDDKTTLLLFLIHQKYTARTFWGPHLRAIPGMLCLHALCLLLSMRDLAPRL